MPRRASQSLIRRVITGNSPPEECQPIAVSTRRTDLTIIVAGNRLTDCLYLCLSVLLVDVRAAARPLPR